MIGPVHQALTGSARIWDAGNAQVMQPCRKALTIEGISLPGQSPDATHPRTLEARIPARRVTAVVCPDGAYRLKLMRLMARWEDPEIGRILIDGADLRDFSIASTRLQIGSIRAEAYVNNGSVIENIALDDPRADLLNVIEAAKAVHAHRMIQRLPQGYDTYIDSEKQPKDQAYLRFLIALARGKWHDPSILMVEEPALPMTRGMKELLRDAYRRLAQDRTVVLFTRHASSVLSADQVIMIGKARVIVGEPRNLLATHKGFRRAMAEMGLGLRPKAKSASRSRVTKASVKTTPPPAAI
jgi:ATP-binding cassette subfamily B protein